MADSLEFIRSLRDLIQYSKSMTDEGTQQINRLHTLLEFQRETFLGVPERLKVSWVEGRP